MADFWGVIGILVSVGLFLVGYRQTVGAKKERVATANQEVEKILVRRVVLEGYTPDLDGVGRLIEGKARDFRVRASDLWSEEQVLNSIFTRVVESDFVSQEKREEILRRLVPAMAQAEEEPVAEQKAMIAAHPRTALMSRTIALGLMGAITSLIGSFVAAFPSLVNFDTTFPKLFPIVLFTLAASGALIGALILFYRLKESQQELPSKGEAVATGVMFEREVANVLGRVGLRYDMVGGARDVGYDFRVDHRGRKILLELKAWSRPIPMRVIAEVAERLRGAVAREGAAEAIIVTPTNLGLPKEAVGEGVRMMTLRDLRNYLAHG